MSTRLPSGRSLRSLTGALWSLLLAALCACSGGSGGPAPADPALPASISPPPAPATPAPAAPDAPLLSAPASGAGIWWQYEYDAENDRILATANCLVAASSELACLLLDANLASDADSLGIAGAMHGNLQLTADGSVTGSGTVYSAPGTVLADGASTTAGFTISGGGMDINRRYLEFTVESLGETRTISLEFDHYYYSPYYYRQDDFALSWSHLVYGVYPDFSLLGEPSSLTVQENGDVFLQTASGCTGNGQLALPDPAFNSHEMSMSLNGCQQPVGPYSGLASLVDYAWVNGTDDLLFVLFTDDSFIAGLARK